MIYTGPLIDAHHHFWDIGMARHPWLVPAPDHEMVFGDPAPLHRNYLPADLEADARSQNLVASVHVEAGWDRSDPVGETAWLSQLARTRRLPTVLVVYGPLDDPEVGKVLEAQSACPLVRGVRFILSWHEDPAKSFVPRRDYMSDRRWLQGFALLAQFGLSFDLMLYPGQMAEAARLAARFPATLILVNHAGSPADRDAEGMSRWRRGLRALAAQPNVRIKISDLVAYDHHWTLETLRPVVLECIEAFGTERAMFASDFPVAGLHATYDQVFGSFKTIVADLTPAEQRCLFHDNAQRDYRITVDGSALSTSS
jgi:predicted TIM-barrel fold metal-dependent hydrolase